MSDFIRWKAVDILTYLPLFIAKDLEFKAISDADSREHERIRLLLIELLKQDNIQSATYALSKWEEFVGISARSDSLHNRRSRVIAKLNNTDSSTKEFLEALANNFISDESAVIIPKNESYTMELKFTKDMCEDTHGLQQTIDEFKPAHIGYEVWEEQLLEQKLIVSGLVVAEEETQISMSKLLSDIEIEHNLYYGSAIGYEEVIEIGG